MIFRWWDNMNCSIENLTINRKIWYQYNSRYITNKSIQKRLYFFSNLNKFSDMINRYNIFGPCQLVDETLKIMKHLQKKCWPRHLIKIIWKDLVCHNIYLLMLKSPCSWFSFAKDFSITICAFLVNRLANYETGTL